MIQDINGLIYIGSTKQKLYKRFASHKYNKKNNKGCSSKLLDLNNSTIIILEECNECDRKIKEKYWIDNTDNVNTNNCNYDGKTWRYENREILKQKKKQYYLNNKEIIKEKQKEKTKERDLFRKVNVVNGCYEFIEMLNHY